MAIIITIDAPEQSGEYTLTLTHNTKHLARWYDGLRMVTVGREQHITSVQSYVGPPIGELATGDVAGEWLTTLSFLTGGTVHINSNGDTAWDFPPKASNPTPIHQSTGISRNINQFTWE